MTALRPPVGAYVALAFQVVGYVHDEPGRPSMALLVHVDHDPVADRVLRMALTDTNARVIHNPEDLYNCGQPPAPHTPKGRS